MFIWRDSQVLHCSVHLPPYFTVRVVTLSVTDFSFLSLRYDEQQTEIVSKRLMEEEEKEQKSDVIEKAEEEADSPVEEEPQKGNILWTAEGSCSSDSDGCSPLSSILWVMVWMKLMLNYFYWIPDPSKIPGGITAEQLYALMDGSTSLILMDTRPSEDFEESHINKFFCISIPEDIIPAGWARS